MVAAAARGRRQPKTAVHATRLGDGCGLVHQGHFGGDLSHPGPMFCGNSAGEPSAGSGTYQTNCSLPKTRLGRGTATPATAGSRGAEKGGACTPIGNSAGAPAPQEHSFQTSALNLALPSTNSSRITESSPPRSETASSYRLRLSDTTSDPIPRDFRVFGDPDEAATGEIGCLASPGPLPGTGVGLERHRLAASHASLPSRKRILAIEQALLARASNFSDVSDGA